MSKGNDIFGRRLKELRLATGISQKQLGIQAGIDQFVASTRINRYENAIHQADYSIAERIAEILKAPPSYFYTDDDILAEIILKYHRSSLTKKKAMQKIISKTYSAAEKN